MATNLDSSSRSRPGACAKTEESETAAMAASEGGLHVRSQVPWYRGVCSQCEKAEPPPSRNGYGKTEVMGAAAITPTVLLAPRLNLKPVR